MANIFEGFCPKLGIIFKEILILFEPHFLLFQWCFRVFYSLVFRAAPPARPALHFSLLTWKKVFSVFSNLLILPGPAKTCWHPGQVITWHPIKTIFFKVFPPKTGMTNILEGVCPKLGIIFKEILSLFETRFPLFQWYLRALYRLVSRAAARSSGPSFFTFNRKESVVGVLHRASITNRPTSMK